MKWYLWYDWLWSGVINGIHFDTVFYRNVIYGRKAAFWRLIWSRGGERRMLPLYLLGVPVAGQRLFSLHMLQKLVTEEGCDSASLWLCTSSESGWSWNLQITSAEVPFISVRRRPRREIFGRTEMIRTTCYLGSCRLLSPARNGSEGLWRGICILYCKSAVSLIKTCWETLMKKYCSEKVILLSEQSVININTSDNHWNDVSTISTAREG